MAIIDGGPEGFIHTSGSLYKTDKKENMGNKILSIEERKPVASTLPDGIYFGKWGGYMIIVQYNEKTYELKTEEGVRGINISVVVSIKDGVATFEEAKN